MRGIYLFTMIFDKHRLRKAFSSIGCKTLFTIRPLMRRKIFLMKSESADVSGKNKLQKFTKGNC